MPLIKLQNHNEVQALSEVVRLFYAEIRIEDHLIIAGNDENIITSRISKISSNAGGHLILSAETTEKTTEVATSCPGQETISAFVLPAAARRELKRQLYCQLELLTNTAFPWGSLTGVRPTQIAYEEYKNSAGDSKLVRQRLIDYWRLSDQKADLAVETALAEEKLISSAPPGSLFVYLGVPFCPSRCSYCSFISRDAKRQHQHLGSYVDAMITEIKDVFSRLGREISGIYLGGGTPTSLSDSDFSRLLEAIKTRIPVVKNAEWTIEAGRPDTITRTKLDLIRQAGVNRICINPQTMHDHTLVKIGRDHTVNETLEAFRLAREFGFSHINMDLIAGLPGETPSDLLDSISQLVNLHPESITLHTLAIKRSSRLQQDEDKTARDQMLPDNELSEAVHTAGLKLRERSYLPYYLYRQKDVVGGLENTGYALPGKECLYNVAMMSDRFDVVGIGSGAMSKKTEGTRTRRQPNSKDLIDYQRRLDELIERKITLFSQP